MNIHRDELLKLQNEDQKLTYLKSIDFNLNVTKSDQQITLSIPNLELKVTGADFGELYDQIQKEKEHYFQEMIKIGDESKICFPPDKKPATFSDLLEVVWDIVKQFKTVLIYGLILVMTAKACSGISKSIKKSNKRLKEKIQENIETATPEKTLERRQRLQKVLNFLKPFYIDYKVFEKEVEQEANKELLKKSI